MLQFTMVSTTAFPLDILANVKEIANLVNNSQSRVKTAVSKARETSNKQKLAKDPDFMRMKPELNRLYQSSVEDQEPSTKAPKGEKENPDGNIDEVLG